MTSVLRIVDDVVCTDFGNEVAVSWALGPTGQQGVKRSYHDGSKGIAFFFQAEAAERPGGFGRSRYL